MPQTVGRFYDPRAGREGIQLTGCNHGHTPDSSECEREKKKGRDCGGCPMATSNHPEKNQ